MRYLPFAFVLLFSNVALAQFDGPHRDRAAFSDGYGPRMTYAGGSTFTAAPMNATRTLDAVRVYGWRFLQLSLSFVYSAAPRAVTMACEQSDDKVTWYRIQALSQLGGTITSEDLTWSKTPTASSNWTWAITLNGYSYIRCSFAVTGGTTSNTLTVTGKVGGDV